MMKLYRYSTNFFDSTNIIGYHEGAIVRVYLHSYDVVKETKCGGWIFVGDETKKFVNVNCLKQYASTSTDIAKSGFLARKKRHINILKAQIMQVEDAVSSINNELIDYNWLLNV